jgi:hypothetical protein
MEDDKDIHPTTPDSDVTLRAMHIIDGIRTTTTFNIGWVGDGHGGFAIQGTTPKRYIVLVIQAPSGEQINVPLSFDKLALNNNVISMTKIIRGALNTAREELKNIELSDTVEHGQTVRDTLDDLYGKYERNGVIHLPMSLTKPQTQGVDPNATAGFKNEDLKRLVPKGQIVAVMNSIKQAMTDEHGGTIIIYDKDMKQIGAGSETQAGAEAQLAQYLKRLSDNGEDVSGFVSTKFSMVALGKTDEGLPSLEATLLTMDKSGRLVHELMEEKGYTIEELMKKGFKSDDIRKLAQDVLTRRASTLKSESNKKLKTKSYSLAEVKKLQKLARKYEA